MRKNISAATVLAFLLCFILVIIMSIYTGENNVYFTNDIINYNTPEYPIIKPIFPAELPVNAHVVSYTYYDYYHEVKDIYLELRFEKLDEMLVYLSAMKNEVVFTQQNHLSSNDTNLFIETPNIYNDLYEESFCTLFWTVQEENTYTGYIITKTEQENVQYKCNFGVISYSVDELTVIHTYVYGWYRSDVHKHTPVYFERFNVPSSVNHKRIFSLG